MTEVVQRAGYFTMLKYIVDRTPGTLEQTVGYAPGSLAAGWKLLLPRFPILAGDIILRGSSRWSGGNKRWAGDEVVEVRSITDILESRQDTQASRHKVAAFFDRGRPNRPAKILPTNEVPDYPPAKEGYAIPQFELSRKIDWVVAAEVPPGKILTGEDIHFH